MSTPDEREDPVARLVRDLSAEEMTGWLIQYHGAHESSKSTIESNLREMFKYHRLQGRLDRHPVLAVFAQLLGLRQSVKALKTPEKPS